MTTWRLEELWSGRAFPPRWRKQLVERTFTAEAVRICLSALNSVEPFLQVMLMQMLLVHCRDPSCNLAPETYYCYGAMLVGL